jgi:hypothetical protein
LRADLRVLAGKSAILGDLLLRHRPAQEEQQQKGEIAEHRSILKKAP